MTTKQLISMLPLLITFGMNGAWAEENASVTSDEGDKPPVSAIETWEEEEPVHEDSWTWFGMGFESRTSGMDGQGGVGTAPSAPNRGGSSRK